MLGTIRVRRHLKILQTFDLYVEHVDMLQTAARVVYEDISMIGQHVCVPSG